MTIEYASFKANKMMRLAVALTLIMILGNFNIGTDALCSHDFSPYFTHILCTHYPTASRSVKARKLAESLKRICPRQHWLVLVGDIRDESFRFDKGPNHVPAKTRLDSSWYTCGHTVFVYSVEDRANPMTCIPWIRRVHEIVKRADWFSWFDEHRATKYIEDEIKKTSVFPYFVMATKGSFAWSSFLSQYCFVHVRGKRNYFVYYW